jgi:hypothetical protein
LITSLRQLRVEGLDSWRLPPGGELAGQNPWSDIANNNEFEKSVISLSDPVFKIKIAITIAIENLIRINHDPFLIAEPDPDFTGKIDRRL